MSLTFPAKREFETVREATPKKTRRLWSIEKHSCLEFLAYRTIDHRLLTLSIASASTAQLRAIAEAYQRRYQRTLVECIRKEFSGHMENALLYMVYRATDPAKVSALILSDCSLHLVTTMLTLFLQHDADMLEATMAGAGTKDVALVRRIVMIHWSRDRMNQCKAAYKHFYKRDLADRVRGETSGDMERLLVAIVSAQ